MPEFTSPRNTWGEGQAHPSIHTPNPPGTAGAPHPTGLGGPGVPGPGLTLPNQPCPISFRYSRLCRPRSADLRSCTVTEPIQLPACPPVPLPTHPSAHLPVLPTSPSQALLSSPCHLVPGLLPPQDAPEHPSPGILHARHPRLQASSHDRGTWGISVPKRDGSRAGSLPLLLRRVCRAEPGTALAFSPFPAPPAQSSPSGARAKGRQQWDHCWSSLPPSTVAILWAGSDTGQEGAQPGTPHIPLPLRGLFTWDQDSWMSPLRVAVSCPTLVLLPWAGTRKCQETLTQGDPAALPRDLGCLSLARALLELSLHHRGDPAPPHQ